MTWDSAIAKFGIDRWAGVASDYGNPDKFKFQLDLQGWEWKGQRLTDGLPVLSTTFEQPGVRLEIEQFAYPLLGPPTERRGDIAMVLLQKVRATALDGAARTVTLNLRHERSLPDAVGVARLGPTAFFEETQSHRVLFSAQGVDTISNLTATDKSLTAALVINVPATNAQEIIFKLPSPLVETDSRTTLAGLDYAAARTATLEFWRDYVARGAQFDVPEPVVNDLFRANLWHALRLPRRHGGQQPGVRMDLPYSNFAYDQQGTPWPVNQSIYVDYMLYDLRGYHAVSAEELAAIYRNNQEPNGHVGGYANWGVYTPSMMYAVAQHGLLSGDRANNRRPAAGDAQSRRLVSGRDRPRPAGGRADAGADRGAVERPLARAEGMGLQSGVLLRRLRAAGAAAARVAAPARGGIPGRREPDAAGGRAGLRDRRNAVAAGALARPHLDSLRAGRRLHAAAVAGYLVSDRRRLRSAAPVAAQGP